MNREKSRNLNARLSSKNRTIHPDVRENQHADDEHGPEMSDVQKTACFTGALKG
jgi:hypothetical protein